MKTACVALIFINGTPFTSCFTGVTLDNPSTYQRLAATSTANMEARKTDNADHAHFAAIPWCAPHLGGERTVTSTPSWRIPQPNGEHAFFAETLNSEKTIIHMLEIYEELAHPTDRIDEFKAFLTLGGGVSGHKDVCHGGFVTAILDEIIGLFIPINLRRKSIPKGMYMTAYLNTTFLKPVPTPTTILVRTRLTRVEGRKYYAEGSIENDKGEVLTRADALYVLRRSTL